MGQSLVFIGSVLGIIVSLIVIYQFVSGNTSWPKRKHKDPLAAPGYRDKEKYRKRILYVEAREGRRSYFGCTLAFITTLLVIYAGYYVFEPDMDVQPRMMLATSLLVASALGLLVFSFSRKRKS